MRKNFSRVFLSFFCLNDVTTCAEYIRARLLNVPGNRFKNYEELEICCLGIENRGGVNGAVRFFRDVASFKENI